MLAERVVRVGQPAAIDGQAAASHTVGEVIPELLEMAYPRLELGLPGLGYSLPVAPCRGAAIRQQSEHGADVGQRDPDSLGDADQRHSPEDIALVTALVARGPPAADQALALVEVQRRDRHTAARRELPYGELGVVPRWFCHGEDTSFLLDLNNS